MFCFWSGTEEVGGVSSITSSDLSVEVFINVLLVVWDWGGVSNITSSDLLLKAYLEVSINVLLLVWEWGGGGGGLQSFPECDGICYIVICGDDKLIISRLIGECLSSQRANQLSQQTSITHPSAKITTLHHSAPIFFFKFPTVCGLFLSHFLGMPTILSSNICFEPTKCVWKHPKVVLPYWKFPLGKGEQQQEQSFQRGQKSRKLWKGENWTEAEKATCFHCSTAKCLLLGNI